MNKTKSILFILISLVVILPSATNAVEIEYGLPDSLQEMNFWGDNGEFSGKLAAEKCHEDMPIIVTPEPAVVDSMAVYTIDVTLPGCGINKLGGMSFLFPNDFYPGQITDIEYSDDYSGADLEICCAFVYGRTISLFFKWTKTPPAGTVVSLTFYSIRNPEMSGSYQIAGLTFSRWFSVLAGPSLSTPFEILPDAPTALNLYPDTSLSMTAGSSQLFEAVATDRFGNVIPDLEYQWSLSEQYDDIGIIANGNLFATTVGTGKVVAAYGDLFAESGLITVLPGELERLEIEEYPLAVESDAGFPSPVAVTAYDAFENLKTDYRGSVYFMSSDPSATLTINEDNPYIFTEADAGRHTFDGVNFIFRTIGPQTLSVTDGAIVSPAVSIMVGGGMIADFDLEYENTVRAGSPLTVHVVDAVDGDGNPANGLVTVTLIEGGVSPGGFEPIVNSIVVQDGSGEADQYIFATGNALLRASFNEVEHDIAFEVLPAELSELILDIHETQFLGNALRGPASITATDKYGNVKIDFDASQAPVTLITGDGVLEPPVIDGADDFVDGVADLAAINMVYTGNSGDDIVSCSSGDIISNNVAVIFNGIVFQMYPHHLMEEIYIGQLIGFSAFADNSGNLTPLEPITYTSYFASCVEACAYDVSISPVAPGEALKFRAYLDTRELEMIPEDTIVIIMDADYLYEGDTVTVRTMVTSPVKIVQELAVEYVEHSLDVDTILSPSTLDSMSFQIRLPDDVDFSGARFKVGIQIESDEKWRKLFPERDGYSLDGNILNVMLYDLNIWDFNYLDDMGEGYRSLRFEGYVNLPDDHFTFPMVENFDSLFVVFPADVAYGSGSLAPTVVGAGAAQVFEFDIILDGLSTIRLDPCRSRLSMNLDGAFVSDACLLDSYLLTPGVNHVITREIYIPDSLINETLTPELVIEGFELYEPRTDILTIEGETIQVADLPRIRILSSEPITFNPPFVNREQEFTIAVDVENMSETDVANASLLIKSEDGIQIYAELDDLMLPAKDTVSFEVTLNAPDHSTPIIIYRAVIKADGAAVMPAEDNTVALVVQSPAEINLSYSLPDAFDGVVDLEQPFRVVVGLENSGEAEAGPGEISLLTGGIDFGIPDSSAATVEIDSAVVFDLTAPSETVTAEMRLKITNPPIDLNTGLPALVNMVSEFFVISVEPGFAELVVNGVIGQSPLIIEGTSRDLFRLELLNNTENSLNVIELREIIIRVTDRDGALISPDLILAAEDCGFFAGDERVAVGERDDNLLYMDFIDYELYPGVEDTIIFRAGFIDDISIGGFSMSIDSRDIRAVFAAGPRQNQSVQVRGKLTDSFRLAGNFAVAVAELGNSLIVRNNPFNPDEGPAELAYILEREADVEMTIYTLTGEKVYETTMRAGTNGGLQGQNYVSWDGANGEGETVLNGIYVMVFKPDYSDESVKLKVAVMK